MFKLNFWNKRAMHVSRTSTIIKTEKPNVNDNQK